MHVLRRALLVSAAILGMAVSPALTQDHNTVSGFGAGLVSFGALNPGAGGAELALDAGPVVTIFGEGWMYGGRVGMRLNGAFTQRPLQFGEETRDLATWMADVSLALRPLPAAEGRPVLPFVSAGVGAINYGFNQGPRRDFPDSNAFYPGDNERQLTVVGGAGLDIIPGRVELFGTPLGLRLEVADHVALRSPLRGQEDERLGPVHNIRVGASLIGLGWF